MANNRYEDKKGRYEIEEVTIRTVDQAVVDYFKKRLHITVDTPSGRDDVKVYYASGERWAMIRKNNFRDSNNTLILPIISIERTGIDRTPGMNSMVREVSSITVSKKIHPKSSNMANRIEARRLNGFPTITNGTPDIYEVLTIPYPDFATAYYTVTIWSQFQEQMNEILQAIFNAYDYADSFVMPTEYDEKTKDPKGKSYYFVGFRENANVGSESNVKEFTEQERIIKYNYTIRVPVYLILNPKDQVTSYGKEDGKPVVYKEQNAPIVSLGEKTISAEEYYELFGDE